MHLTPWQGANVLFGVWLISWLAAALWRAPAARRPATSREIVYRVLVGVGAILLFGVFDRERRSPLALWRTPVPIGWMLVVVLAVGLAFTWWARIHLGRLWSSSVTRKADHHIVDTGPYRLVRHPIYTGIIVSTVAIAAIRGTAVAWLGVVVMTIGWVVKARLEESFLREELGRAGYDAYAARVPMLVPGTGARHR